MNDSRNRSITGLCARAAVSAGAIILSLVLVQSCTARDSSDADMLPADASKEITLGHPLRNGAGSLSFISLLNKSAGRIQLANGVLAVDKALWSSVAVTTIDAHGFCTATLIGPNVLLTAAHCVDAEKPPGPDGKNSSDTLSGSVSFGEAFATIDCRMYSKYASAPLALDGTPRNDDDYALCELSTPVTTVLAESIDAGPNLASGDSILMSGYGCTDIKVVGGKFVTAGSDRKLRLGTEKVDAADVLNSTSAGGNYLRTRSKGNEPTLCPGDSGGPAYRGQTIEPLPDKPRRVSAVNSKVAAVLGQDGKFQYLSFMAPLTTSAFRDFLKEWVTPERKICGLQIEAGQASCRK